MVSSNKAQHAPRTRHREEDEQQQDREEQEPNSMTMVRMWYKINL